MSIRITFIDMEKTVVVLKDQPVRRIIFEEPPLLFTPKSKR